MAPATRGHLKQKNKNVALGILGCPWKGPIFQNIAAYGNAPAPQVRTEGRALAFLGRDGMPKHAKLFVNVEKKLELCES